MLDRRPLHPPIPLHFEEIFTSTVPRGSCVPAEQNLILILEALNYAFVTQELGPRGAVTSM